MGIAPDFCGSKYMALYYTALKKNLHKESLTYMYYVHT